MHQIHHKAIIIDDITIQKAWFILGCLL